MAVVRRLSASLPIAGLFPVSDSLGAHLAAKLEQFGTDERTLTDELCDMFMIWCQVAEERQRSSPPPPSAGRFASRPLHVDFSKTTQQEEATVGADLLLRLHTPDGVKRALIQAKVFDPRDDRLRCDSPAGWDKLWSQLVLMRQHNGDLSFLLVYVPGSRLDGQQHGFETWEQAFPPPAKSPTNSRFGVTLVPVDSLLSSTGFWRNVTPIRHVGSGRFYPPGLSFRRLLLEMLVCRRGRWQSPDLFGADGVAHDAEQRDTYPVRFVPYRELGISFAENSANQWRPVIEELQDVLRDEERNS